MILAAVVAASALLYEARVPTFGCSSAGEVLKLEAVRSDAAAFGQLLTEQVAYGQCVTIPRGAVVEASTVEADAPTLLINTRRDPPGYRVPSKDFRPASTSPASSGSPADAGS